MADNNPIYIKGSSTGEDWELTWPIWHMLPRDERKAIAVQHGFQKIGEFEEYMSLHKAVANTSEAPYENSQLYEFEANPQNYGRPTVATKYPKEDEKKEEDSGDDEEDAKISALGEKKDDARLNRKHEEELTNEELLEFGGQILLLPEELILKCFSFLHVDMFGVLALVSPHWKFVSRTEAVYKLLCERSYLKQSKRKTLHVARFGSYRNMLERRPRVRTGGGLYAMKYSQIHKIQRDMWTEIPVGAVLETVYYRYLYFHEDGRVLYALTTCSPLEMIARFIKMKRIGEGDKAAVWGRYEVQKDNVTVLVEHPWNHVKIEVKILALSNLVRGRFCTLSFERHLSSVSGNFDEYWSHDIVEYEVPESHFVFLKDGRL